MRWLGLFVAFLLAVAFGALPRRPQPSPAEPGLSPQAVSSSPAAKDRPARGAGNPEALLENGRPAELFAQLFAPGHLAASDLPALISAAGKRFANPYPESAPAPEFREEVVSRLGILKAFAAHSGNPEMQAFLLWVLENPREHWMVQRQAIRDLQLWLSTVSETEHFRILGKADPRAVAHAGLSESELLGQIVKDVQERNPAHSATRASLNDYAELPCPTEEEFTRLAEAVHWVRKIPQFICDMSIEGRVGKLLFLLKGLDLGASRSALSGPVAEDLRNPWDFFSQRVEVLDIDLNQSATTAYNLDGTIHLGAAFFRESPLEALETLIHEARHSDDNDPGHDVCVQGDIPGVAGGCDRELDDGIQAGGYSYGGPCCMNRPTA
jgi:hypothetical protein